MLLNRSQKRFFMKKSAEGKRLQALSFFHPDKIALRRKNMETGAQQHEEYTRSIQEKMAENLGPREQELISLLKGNEVGKKDIDAYMDIWAGVNFWPKPDDFYALRKQLRSLNKKYKING